MVKKIIKEKNKEKIIPDYDNCPNCENKLIIRKNGNKFCLKCGTEIEKKQ